MELWSVLVGSMKHGNAHESPLLTYEKGIGDMKHAHPRA